MAPSLALRILATVTVFLTALAAVSNAINLTGGILPQTLRLFDKWCEKYSINFSNEERQTRLQIFAENLSKIKLFNNLRRRPYKLTLNKFAHLTFDEFRAKYLGFKAGTSNRTDTSSGTDTVKKSSAHTSSFNSTTKLAPPVSVDWRKRGVVTPVKDQKECGSCWAFTAAAVIESIHKMKRGTLFNISPQELVDCDSGNSGCDGGDQVAAYEYIIENGGISIWREYPYEAQGGTCSSDEVDTRVTIRSYVRVPENNEAAMKVAVNRQPISVSIEADDNLQFYSGGVYTGPCGTEVNHAVTIVGYGVTKARRPYWLVKNSWGKDWGENGYVRFLRNHKNKIGLCAIASDASYPVI